MNKTYKSFTTKLSKMLGKGLVTNFSCGVGTIWKDDFGDFGWTFTWLLRTKAPSWGGGDFKISNNHGVFFGPGLTYIYNIQILTVYKGLTYVTVCNIFTQAQRNWIWIQSHYIPFHNSRLLSGKKMIRGQYISSVLDCTINIQYTNRDSLLHLSSKLVFTWKKCTEARSLLCH